MPKVYYSESVIENQYKYSGQQTIDINNYSTKRKKFIKPKRLLKKSSLKVSNISEAKLRNERPKYVTNTGSLKKYLSKFKIDDNDNTIMDEYLEMRLRDLIPMLLREYDAILKDSKFIYKSRKVFPRYTNKINVHYLVYDDRVGYTAITITHTRKMMSLSKWKRFVKSDELYNGLTKNIFPAINVHYSRKVVLKDIIGWTYVI